MAAHMPLDMPDKASAEAQPGFSEKHGTLYAQVASVMRQRIHSGQWETGAQIPTLEALEREFGVARVTLRQALSLLESDGMIWRARGRGTFVTDTARPEWFELATSRDELIHSLEGNWSRMIEVDPRERAPHLEPGDGTAAPAYRHMRRLHGRGERAYAVVDMHLDKAVYARAPGRFDSEMIIPVLETLPGLKIADIRQTLTIGTADRGVAGPLGVPIGAPIGILRRVVRDMAGQVVYVGVVNYRGDLVKLEITLSGDGNGAAE